jgi:PKD repeat protein
VDLAPDHSGQWISVPGKGRLWHLTLSAVGAKALSPYFDVFYIPDGGELYLYNDPASRVLGAYTSANNPLNHAFATEFVRGSSITFEYFEPYGVHESLKLHIADIGYFYRGINGMGDLAQRDFGDSGECEVNISCDEGNGWQDEKKGVLRILSRVGSSLFWCNGSLINNVRQDFTPYVLTADHCAFYNDLYASTSDLTQWIFYFNYESLTCTDPSSEPAYNTLVGATLKAHGGSAGDTGSDFYLVCLNDLVPAAYDPFFLGWDRQNGTSPEGVCIHHPQGDIKKISTYTQSTVSSQWSNNGLQSHWLVYWTETSNGHGVTESGSSGSPLFNEHGLIVGTLTGGESSCGNTGGADFYGKFSYHWKSNGSSPGEQLEPWLDPDQEGVQLLGGTYYENIVVALFKADTTVVPVNGKTDFVDLSTGKPEQWQWYFEGGSPSASIVQNPEGIVYSSYGTYDVRLISGNEINTDTLILNDYIRVEPVIIPNPSHDEFRIFFGDKSNTPDRIEVFNALGMRVPFLVSDLGSSKLTLDLTGMSAGMYLVRLRADSYSFNGKLWLVP